MSRTGSFDLGAFAAILLAGCADKSDFTLTPVEDWTTEAEYEIDDQVRGDEFFGPHLDVRAAGDGSRVYVLDLQASQVTIWTPGATLVRRLGRSGGGPGEFQGPGRLGLAAGGFYVRDYLRITMFTPDGELTGTRPFPLELAHRGFPVQVLDLFPDGSFAAVPSPAKMTPGFLELVEISTGRDTLWTRGIQLPPMPLTEGQTDAEVEEWAAMIAASTGDTNASPMLKSRLRAAWFIPEYWPAVREIRLMSNGEIWFEPLGLDTRGLWYAVRKGANEGPIKRITVPESFQPLDVTATHVWGIRRDELDVGYVTGLRLRPGR